MVDPTDRQRPKLQVSLSSFLLLIATCCVWIGYWKVHSDTLKLEPRLARLRTIARELVVGDPKKLAAIERRGCVSGQKIMELYVPELDGKHFEMRLAMDNIPSLKDFKANQIEPLKRAVLKPGKHFVKYRYGIEDEQAVVAVDVDGETVIQEIRQKKDWSHTCARSLSLSVTYESKSFENNEIVQLVHRLFRTEKTKNGSFTLPLEPGPGISLWVQTIADSVEDEK